MNYRCGTIGIMLGRIWVKTLVFLSACVFAAVFSCSAQTTGCISVRALDSKSGKPLRDVSIVMNAALGGGPSTNREYAKTDSNGVAQLCPIDPISHYLGLSFDSKFDSCSGYAFETAVILDRGFLADNTLCAGRRFKLNQDPKAGELVILVRHRTLLERIDWL